MDTVPNPERQAMVERQLEPRGIRDPLVLEAMGAVPREVFLPPERRHLAYSDQAVPIGQGQTISQPYMVAAMTEALRPRPGDQVLEVGTGSGYQTAVLARIVAEVFTVERFEPLSEAARRTLDSLDVANVRYRVGDGSLGWPEEGPFDGILVTAGAPRVPDVLKEQLSDDGGRLVIPVGPRSTQELVRYVKEGTEIVAEHLMACRFVPLVGEEGWEEDDGTW